MKEIDTKSNKKIYLSIDLDYWLTEHRYDRPSIGGLFRILNQVKHLPCILVEEHHDILEHMELSNCDEIIHVDYHQDIAYPFSLQIPGRHESWEVALSKMKLDCSNFFWFLNRREEMTYTWFYPSSECPKEMGLCVDPDDKPHAKKNWIFKDQRKKKGLPTLKSLKNVVAVGIACSRDYCFFPSEIDRLENIVRKRYLSKSIRFEDKVKPIEETGYNTY